MTYYHIVIRRWQRDVPTVTPCAARYLHLAKATAQRRLPASGVVSACVTVSVLVLIAGVTVGAAPIGCCAAADEVMPGTVIRAAQQHRTGDIRLYSPAIYHYGQRAVPAHRLRLTLCSILTGHHLTRGGPPPAIDGVKIAHRCSSRRPSHQLDARAVPAAHLR